MLLGKRDSTTSKVRVNNYVTEDHRVINLHEYGWMPSVTMRVQQGDKAKLDSFDISKDTGPHNDDSYPIDYDKLQKYVQFVMNVRVRDKDGSHHRIYKFRNCKESDFEEADIKITENFRRLIGNRFCPDVPHGEEIKSLLFKGFGGGASPK